MTQRKETCKLEEERNADIKGGWRGKRKKRDAREKRCCSRRNKKVARPSVSGDERRVGKRRSNQTTVTERGGRHSKRDCKKKE